MSSLTTRQHRGQLPAAGESKVTNGGAALQASAADYATRELLQTTMTMSWCKTAMRCGRMQQLVPAIRCITSAAPAKHGCRTGVFSLAE